MGSLVQVGDWENTQNMDRVMMMMMDDDGDEKEGRRQTCSLMALRSPKTT
jgi:hypothetical protein